MLQGLMGFFGTKTGLIVVGVLLGFLLISGGINYFLYNKTVSLSKDNATLTVSVNLQKEAINSLKNDLSLQKTIVQNLYDEVRKSQLALEKLRKKLNDSDLEKLAETDPKAAENTINSIIADLFNCVSINSGATAVDLGITQEQYDALKNSCNN